MNKLTKNYIIDFTNVKYYLEMHYVIRKALDFPDYYGCNWDAFWDCMTDMCVDPINIEIIGLDVIERKFGDAAKIMLETLTEVKDFAKGIGSNVEVSVVNGNVRSRIV